MDNSLLPFFSPQGVAIIGASSSPEKLGYGVARNLVNSGYRGAVHFVSPRGGNLFGRPVYAALSQIPDPVDLAVLIVPASLVTESLQECAARGIRAAIVVSSGFRESGPDGAALEEDMLRLAQAHGIRLIGPNCIGLLDTHLPLDTTFLPPPMPKQGDVAFISQSGAICAAIIDWARGQGFGFSRLISLGNQADVDESDMLAAVANDEHTRVLTLYLESIQHGERFLQAARQVTRQKPVIALKVGRSEAGQRAAASHTGALAGTDTAYQAAFAKTGIIRADTSEEMFDFATALANCPLPRGRNTAVLTNAGGPGVIAADALEAHGLPLAALSPHTLQALATYLPPAAGLNNPVDMLASASPEDYAHCLTLLLADPQVDAGLVILPPPPMYSANAVARALIPVIHTSAKPVVIALMGENLIKEAAQTFRQARIPEYRFPERAAAALRILAERAEYLSRLDDQPAAPTDVDTDSAQQIFQGAQPGTWLDPESVDRLLGVYRIPTAPVKLAANAEQAAQWAKELGLPVVLKIGSPDLPHKSDVGGVLLNLQTASQVHEGFTRITKRVQAARPDARLEGVHIQRMIPDGQEVILGVVRDAQFGALVMFGSGGVEVEGLKDVAFALAPLTEREAESLIDATWAGKKLSGFRNIPAVDRKAVINALVRLSWLVHDHPQIHEIEINPLRALSYEAIALDTRIRLFKPGM